MLRFWLCEWTLARARTSPTAWSVKMESLMKFRADDLSRHRCFLLFTVRSLQRLQRKAMFCANSSAVPKQTVCSQVSHLSYWIHHVSGEQKLVVVLTVSDEWEPPWRHLVSTHNLDLFKKCIIKIRCKNNTLSFLLPFFSY